VDVHLTVPFSPWWQFLLAGGDGVREDMPSERRAAKGTTKLPGAYLDGIDAFDAAFFGTSYILYYIPNIYIYIVDHQATRGLFGWVRLLHFYSTYLTVLFGRHPLF
jgi:hypothetical protein